jgi:hypothetical protein
MLMDDRNNVLMKITLPPLKKTAYAMSGQVLVFPSSR